MKKKKKILFFIILSPLQFLLNSGSQQLKLPRIFELLSGRWNYSSPMILWLQDEGGWKTNIARAWFETSHAWRRDLWSELKIQRSWSPIGCRFGVSRAYRYQTSLWRSADSIQFRKFIYKQASEKFANSFYLSLLYLSIYIFYTLRRFRLELPKPKRG